MKIDATRIVNFYSYAELAMSGKHTEDGTTIFLEAYTVVAETARGHRWERFVGADETEANEDGFDCLCPNEKAREASHVLAEKLNSLEEPKLNPDVWRQITSVYGSLAWNQADEDSLKDAEEQRYTEHKYGH